MELLARLADNFWLKPQWGDGAAVYDNPLDVEFTRDLEPSIMPADQEMTTRTDLPQVPPLICEPLPVEQRGDWVADPDLPGSHSWKSNAPAAASLIRRSLSSGERRTAARKWKSL